MTDSSIFNEIHEDLRRQRLASFWQQNARWILGSIVLAVVLTAGLTFWRGHKAGQNMAATQQLIVATQDGEAALENFTATYGGDHAALARLTVAGRYAQNGETAKAIAHYDALAAARGVERVYRDLATVLSVGQQVETGDAAVLLKRLAPLTDKKNTWRFSALELQALILARQGRMQDAAAALTKISSDPQAPQDLRTRAFTFRELYMGAASTQNTQGK